MYYHVCSAFCVSSNFRYAQKSFDLLVNLKNIEESLRRLQKKSLANQGAVSDETKIRRQIFIDAAQYGQQVVVVCPVNENVAGVIWNR